MAGNKMHVKKNDMVQVLAGKDKGKSGNVLRVIPETGRVLVAELNKVKKHSKPSQANPEGGIIEKEAALAVSNVMLVCPACAKPSKTGVRNLEDGSKARFCKKCNEIVDK